MSIEIDVVATVDDEPKYTIELASSAIQESLPEEVIEQAREYGMGQSSGTDFDGGFGEQMVDFHDDILTSGYTDIRYWTKLRYTINGATGVYIPRKSYSYTLNDLIITHEYVVEDEGFIVPEESEDGFKDLVAQLLFIEGGSRDFDHDRKMMHGMLLAARTGIISNQFLKDSGL